MGNHWAIPLVFGILFFSTVFSAQDIYGPHYTNFDGTRHHYQGIGQSQVSQFDVSILISEGLANPKKNANFEVCVRLDTASDSFQTEIISMNLESCQPITVGGQETDLNFLRVLVPVIGPPVFTQSMIVDISGSYEIKNPAGKSMTGEIEFLAEDVVLDILTCIPSTTVSCESDPDCEVGEICVPTPGTCEACVCPDVWDPVCGENGNSYSNSCEARCAHAQVVHEGPCLTTCESNDDCESDLVCIDGACQVPCQIFCIVPDPVCGVDGNTYWCGNADAACNGIEVERPGECTPSCQPTGDEVCTDGIDNDCDGSVDFSDEDCVSEELCDGFDNDGDGAIDEGFDVGGSCKVGIGACEREGQLVCGSFCGETCNASPGEPLPENNQEACTDGIDNDCDGLTDCDDTSCLDADLGVTCSLPLCGDGTVNPGESCDGADLNGQTCVGLGHDGGTLACDSVCGFDESGCFSCGDGTVNPGESCDDGNTRDGDGCSSRCQIEEPTVAHLVINEIHYDPPRDLEDMEYVEIFNPTNSEIDLTGMVLRFVTGIDCTTYNSVDLSPARVLGPGGYLVVGDEAILQFLRDNLPTVPSLPLGDPDLPQRISNGPGSGVLLLDGNGIIDQVQYLGETESCRISETSPFNDFIDEQQSIGRFPDGFDSDNNSRDFIAMLPTPGFFNTP